MPMFLKNIKDTSERYASRMMAPSGQSLPDQAAVVDKFEIGRYINGLAHFIENCKMPMTIAIQGDWGTGKTSIMKMVQKKIDEENAAHSESGSVNEISQEASNIKIINFNTWQFSQFNMDKGLPLIMLERLISMLQYKDTHLSNFRSDESIDALKRVMATIGDLIGGTFVQGDINIVKRLFEGNSIKEFAKLGDKYKDLIEDILDIHHNGGKESADSPERAQSADDRKRVIFFIDDLDRLEPSTAVELLEVLKLFLDCPHCVYVLAIDYSVVIRGVKAKYGKDFDEEKGRAFFDKIIQVPFQVPVERYDINNFIKSCMNETGITPPSAAKDGIGNVKNYTSLVKHSIGNNPRAIKRLFNAFLLLENILGEESYYKDEKKQILLFALQCMQNTSGFYPFYQYLIQKRDDDDMIDDLLTLDQIDSEFYDLFKVKDSQKEKFQDCKEKFANFISTLYNILGITNKDKNDEIWKDIIEVISYSSDTAVSLQPAPSSVSKQYTRVTTKYEYRGQTYERNDRRGFALGNLCRKMIIDFIDNVKKNHDEMDRLKAILDFRHLLKDTLEKAEINIASQGDLLFIYRETGNGQKVDIETAQEFNPSIYSSYVTDVDAQWKDISDTFHINICRIWYALEIPELIETLKWRGYDPKCTPLKS